jgi:hypothetical protein
MRAAGSRELGAGSRARCTERRAAGSPEPGAGSRGQYTQAPSVEAWPCRPTQAKRRLEWATRPSVPMHGGPRPLVGTVASGSIRRGSRRAVLDCGKLLKLRRFAWGFWSLVRGMTKVRGVRATGHRLQVTGCSLRVPGYGSRERRFASGSFLSENRKACSRQLAPLLSTTEKPRR